MKRIFFTMVLAVIGYGCASTPQSTRSCTEPRPRYTITAAQNNVSLGNIVIQLFPEVAPMHVCNFDSLVGVGFYNGTAFHRVIPGFMIQGGDPGSRSGARDAWGRGEPGQRKIPAEFNDSLHVRGRLSAARTSDPNSATSQFFITVVHTKQLDGSYTVFGEVVSGMEVVDQIVSAPRDERDNPVSKIEMRITKNK